MTLLGFGTLTLVTCVLAPLVGSTHISLTRAFDRSIPFEQNVDAQIFFVARLPRVLAGALVGATLATSGVVFQAMLRNPLATPFTLGVSAGSSLGAMLAIIFGATLTLGPLSPVPLASLAGAMLAASIVYWLATPSGRAMSTSVLLLAGVTLNSFFLGADHVRAVCRRLRPGVPRRPLADGRPSTSADFNRSSRRCR